MIFSRTNPSPKYLELIGHYRSMHGQSEKMFSGKSLPRQAHRIKSLIARVEARTILDYGSGKATQYRPAPVSQNGVVRWNSIQEYWGVEEIRCYDPGYAPLSTLPQGTFDGVVCTDVLEHCPQQDLRWIVEGLCSYAKKFVFANVACYPAGKTLPNGENAHCTILPVATWKSLFAEASARFSGLLWEVWIEELRGGREERVANFSWSQAPVRQATRPSSWRMV